MWNHRDQFVSHVDASDHGRWWHSPSSPFSLSSCKSAVPDADHGNAVFGRCGPGGGCWRWDQEVSRSPWHQNHGYLGLVGHQLGTAGPCLGQAFDGRMASRRIEPDHFDTIRAADCHGDIAPHVVGVQVFVVEDASSGNTSLISDGYTTFITCEWIGSACSRRESSEATPTWSMEQAPSQLWAAANRWPQQDFPCAGSPGGRASPCSAPLGTWDFEVVHTGETRWALGTSHFSPVGGNQPALQEGAFWQHLGDLRQQAGSTGRDKLAAQECAGHHWWVGFHQRGPSSWWASGTRWTSWPSSTGWFVWPGHGHRRWIRWRNFGPLLHGSWLWRWGQGNPSRSASLRSWETMIALWNVWTVNRSTRRKIPRRPTKKRSMVGRLAARRAATTRSPIPMNGLPGRHPTAQMDHGRALHGQTRPKLHQCLVGRNTRPNRQTKSGDPTWSSSAASRALEWQPWCFRSWLDLWPFISLGNVTQNAWYYCSVISHKLFTEVTSWRMTPRR